jgi:hypothetical protein
VTEPSPHLDLDALADALAGEGDDAADAAHLASCASCTSRLAELAAAETRVVAVLSSLPPPQLPADLADRLTAALAAEGPLRPAASTGVTTLAARRPRRNWLPAAAAAVLVLAGGGLGLALVKGGGVGGGADHAATSAADGDSAGSDLVLNSSGTDWSDADAIAAVLPSVLQGEAGEVSLDSTGGAAVGAEAQPLAETSEQARSSEDEATTYATGPQVASAPLDPLARLRTPEGLASCLAGVLSGEPDTSPVALDYAQWQGQPALAVLLPDPDPAVLAVFLVGPGCSQADAAVLHFVRVPRP